ncbi:presenilin-like protein At2g29900 isoform X1 [Cucumis melo]|uniref:Presenilin n=1 Tax=Cucumis melo TaxID=3656 RepID=A0A1S3BQN9_CUCME|nr:presenilin-like protein At2g29900 isoform X1 [Cucumis melo]
MAENKKPTSILESLGEEIVRIVAPVSICMFMVVILVSILNSNSSSSYATVGSIATIAYNESSSDTSWDKFIGALLNSLVFVAVITLATFLMVLLFYLRCVKFLKYYMGFSAFVVLGFLGGEIALFLIEDFSIPIDCFTFLVALFNFAAVGVLAVFMSKMAILVTQGYLVLIGMLVAYWFTLLPEWTTWALLVALAVYDLAAVLLPVGPLRLLVELAISRDEDIPALVYEARPVVNHDSNPRDLVQRRMRVWRERNETSDNRPVAVPDSVSDGNVVSESNVDEIETSNSYPIPIISTAVRAEEGEVHPIRNAELLVPLIDNGGNVQPHGVAEASGSNENLMLEGIGLGSSGAIKLGLGDFIFYSVLVGRAAMYDYMTVYACYLAIVAGLGITLMLLAIYQKALPALPVSIALGIVFYFLTRLFLEVFVVQCSLNLLMF